MVKMKQEKTIITPKYLKIKDYFKSKVYDKEILNDWCIELLELLGDLTMQGVTEIEGVDIDLFKMRVWVIVEKSGNLAPFRDEEDDIDLEKIGCDDKDWYLEKDVDVDVLGDDFFKI